MINEDITYVGRLYDWSNFEDTINKLEVELDAEINAYIVSTDILRYIDIYNGFNIFLYLLLSLFVILSIITIINVLMDEKKTNFLYRIIGYSKKKKISIVGYSKKKKISIVVLKLFSLLIISLAFSTTGALILKIIFKW